MLALAKRYSWNKLVSFIMEKTMYTHICLRHSLFSALRRSFEMLLSVVNIHLYIILFILVISELDSRLYLKHRLNYINYRLVICQCDLYIDKCESTGREHERILSALFEKQSHTLIHTNTHLKAQKRQGTRLMM